MGQADEKGMPTFEHSYSGGGIRSRGVRRRRCRLFCRGVLSLWCRLGYLLRWCIRLDQTRGESVSMSDVHLAGTLWQLALLAGYSGLFRGTA